MSGGMTYKCRHPGCRRFFDTKLGRSVHERLVHGVDYTGRKTGYMCPHCKAFFETEIGLEIHLEDVHGMPSKSIDWIERRTFENMIYLYTDELHKIQSDRVIEGVLGEREKSKLLREGVLIIEEYGRMGKPTIYRLSDEALEALRKLELEDEENK